jgi:hypothetical protein
VLEDVWFAAGLRTMVLELAVLVARAREAVRWATAVAEVLREVVRRADALDAEALWLVWCGGTWVVAASMRGAALTARTRQRKSAKLQVDLRAIRVFLRVLQGLVLMLVSEAASFVLAFRAGVAVACSIGSTGAGDKGHIALRIGPQVSLSIRLASSPTGYGSLVLEQLWANLSPTSSLQLQFYETARPEGYYKPLWQGTDPLRDLSAVTQESWNIEFLGVRRIAVRGIGAGEETAGCRLGDRRHGIR